MRFIEPGLHHYLYASALLRLPRAAQVIAATRAVGEFRYRTSPAHRRDIVGCYQALINSARTAGHEIQDSAETLAYRQITLRPLLGVTGEFLGLARQSVVDDLIDSEPLAQIIEAYRRGKGMILMSAHFGANGSVSALLYRHGIPLVAIRDAQFQRFEGTRHGRHYYLGAESLYPDHADPASADRVLLRCARILREGGIVSYLCDAGHGRSIAPTPVLGQPAPWRMALVSLAARIGAVVVPVFVPFRQGRVRIILEKIYELSRQSEAEGFAVEFGHLYERMLLTHPECILWNNFERRLLANQEIPWPGETHFRNSEF